MGMLFCEALNEETTVVLYIIPALTHRTNTVINYKINKFYSHLMGISVYSMSVSLKPASALNTSSYRRKKRSHCITQTRLTQ